MVEIEGREFQETPQELFKSRLKSAISFLEERKINYRVLGSVGCCGVMGVDFNPLREDGSWRDLDMLLEEGADQELISRLTGICSPIKLCSWRNQCISLFKNGEGCLKLWGKKYPVNEDFLRPNRGSVLGVDFDSLQPQALLHCFIFYIALNGKRAVRDKDRETFYRLGRFVKESGNLKSLCSDECKPFHYFLSEAKARRKTGINRFIFNGLEIYNKAMLERIRARIPKGFKTRVTGILNEVIWRKDKNVSLQTKIPY